MSNPALALLLCASALLAFAGGICVGAKIAHAKHQAEVARG